MVTQPQVTPQTIQVIEHTLNRLTDVAKADAIFGQPIERNGVTVIPCSEVSLGLGMGSGTGTSPTKAQEQQRAGEGVGAGGGARGRPIAVIVVTHDKVRVQPILNVTRIALSLFTTLGLAFFGLTRLASARRTGRPFRGPAPFAMRRAIRRRKLGRMRGRAAFRRLVLNR